MTDIYDQHAKAFAQTSAYVILKDGERVATIAFKFPRDGAGRLYAYVHWLGTLMVRGFADGYGYDKRSAAVYSAIMQKDLIKAFNKLISTDSHLLNDVKAFHDGFRAFRAALGTDDGQYWDRRLEKAGFKVLQAV